MPQQSLPLVSLDILRDLETSLGDGELCRRYVGSYVDLWTARMQRLGTACGSLDWEAAMDAALSVKTSSRMVGALRLGHHAEELEQLIRGRQGTVARAWKPLERCGANTMDSLRDDYLQHAA